MLSEQFEFDVKPRVLALVQHAARNDYSRSTLAYQADFAMPDEPNTRQTEWIEAVLDAYEASRLGICSRPSDLGVRV